jgi:hypothetical protein
MAVLAGAAERLGTPVWGTTGSTRRAVGPQLAQQRQIGPEPDRPAPADPLA